MKPKETDPLRLDVAALAAAGARLEGRWPLRTMPRLAGSANQEAPPAHGADDVEWAARGEQRPSPGAAPEIWLHLRARATVRLQCQRCLAPMDETLQLDRWLRFVAGAEAAAALDGELEDDVLELHRSLDLRELLEDELLLALPLVPRHAACPRPLSAPPTGTDDEPQQPHPFAALRALRTSGRKD